MCVRVCMNYIFGGAIYWCAARWCHYIFIIICIINSKSPPDSTNLCVTYRQNVPLFSIVPLSNSNGAHFRCSQYSSYNFNYKCKYSQYSQMSLFIRHRSRSFLYIIRHRCSSPVRLACVFLVVYQITPIKFHALCVSICSSRRKTISN